MRIRACAVYCLAITGALGQTAPDYSHFEVASVRASTRPRNLPEGRVPAPISQGGPGSTSPEQISLRYLSLRSLILRAFGIPSMQLAAPPWASAELYDISATLPRGASKEQLETMLQNLLQERFGLTFHHEARVLPVYALTVAKGGLKLKESNTTASLPDGPRSGAADKDGFPSPPSEFVGAAGRPSNGRLLISGQKMTLAQLLQAVGERLDRPTVDQTGVTGTYDFKMEI